ncbi:YHS domain-containing protein [Fimbriiglobus ruber]|uniref:YHS domain-containing protein n=1 Tax=Fimbriiglobus ruber TaxID=1908690 RepID=A0A225DBJ4_9BACT|nr:YHS domain-containing protein [Fimbriiglobus ruber]OWK34519.1 hypothetical protein FRUB_10490 [Fimbriiglobus ruber]
MTKYRFLAATGLLAGLLLAATGPAADKGDAEANKKALQEVGDLAGEWKGSGEAKIAGRNTIWKETINWGWKFDKKNGDAWITLEVKDGKFLSGGSLKYDAEKKLYRLTATDTDKKEMVYEGKLTKKGLILERKEAGSGDVHRLTVFTLADGARMMVQGDVQTKGKGPFSTEFKIAANNAAESFAGGGGKKPECVVTGGLGTMAVSYNGKTYYVCCSGCREEFTANPKKFVDEFEKKKK